MDYDRMLAKLLSKSEFENLKDSIKGWDDYCLYKHLAEVGVIRSFDWRHCDEHSIYLFVDERLFSIVSLGLEAKHITPSSATELYNEIHPNGKRNFVSFVLKFYNKSLKSTGLKIMTINRQDDAYNLVVVKSIDAPKLKRIKSDFWNFCDL